MHDWLASQNKQRMSLFLISQQLDALCNRFWNMTKAHLVIDSF